MLIVILHLITFNCHLSALENVLDNCFSDPPDIISFVLPSNYIMSPFWAFYTPTLICITYIVHCSIVWLIYVRKDIYYKCIEYLLWMCYVFNIFLAGNRPTLNRKRRLWYLYNVHYLETLEAFDNTQKRTPLPSWYKGIPWY